MSTKTIPAKTIMTCDGCGIECTTSNRRKDGGLHIKEDALDYQGHAVADASQKYDLCDKCLTVVVQAIGAAISGQKPAEGEKV